MYKYPPQAKLKALQEDVLWGGGGGGGRDCRRLSMYRMRIHMYCREPGYVVKHAMVSEILLVELKNS